MKKVPARCRIGRQLFVARVEAAAGAALSDSDGCPAVSDRAGPVPVASVTAKRDRLQVTIFPVISGLTGTSPILKGAGDFDLELLESRTLDGHTQELVYRPTPR